MAHYVALRRRDLRDLQQALRPLGLSSLGRLEGHVLPALDAVTRTLALIAGLEDAAVPPYPSTASFQAGERLLATRALRLFGPAPKSSGVRIMATLDPANETGESIAGLVQRGATVFRVNCAHDGPAAWRAVIAAVRAVERETGRALSVLLDLAGPKVRTAQVLNPHGAPRIAKGDHFAILDGALRPDAPWEYQVTTTVHGLAARLTPGANVLIDDGHIEAVVEAVEPGAAVARVVRARAKGEKLQPDRGLNVPGVDLPVDALSAKDLADLDIAVELADLAGLSFVRRASDVAWLRDEIAKRAIPGRELGIIAKVETPEAFRALPAILVEGLAGGPFGVMIARGDLAVEVGFERLVEVQEELLWLCEAAHVPVIWATQVLEGLSKEGVFSRAEVTDAAMASRAECVMLNKGPHVAEAVTALAGLFERMAGHQKKKSAQLRALRAW
jgi:pyruvate kinase